jgi:hypothetical protein
MIQLQHHGVPVPGLQLLHRLLDALHVAGRDVRPGSGNIPVLAFDQTVQLIEAERQRLARPDREQALVAGRRRHLDVDEASIGSAHACWMRALISHSEVITILPRAVARTRGPRSFCRL